MVIIMAKKKAKKKNYRLRKQIRRTFGALFMISAIIVAAIPVPDMWAAGDGTTPAVKVEVSNQIDSSGQYAAGASEFKSKVPYVSTNEPVYTTGDNMFQFAYINPASAPGKKIAVILGCTEGNLPGNELTLPDTVDAYRQYQQNTSYGDPCAVSESNEFLYYNVADVKGKSARSSGGVYEPVFDSEGNYAGTTYTDAAPAAEEEFLPCYYKTKYLWEKIDDTKLYYKTTVDGQDKYIQVGEGADSSQHLRIHDAEVHYIGNQKAEAKYVTVKVPDGSGGQKDEQVFDHWEVSEHMANSSNKNGVFAGVRNLSKLNIGETLLGVGDYAFYGCTNLSSVKFGNGINSIGNGAFENCQNMVSVDIPVVSAIKWIGREAFKNCQALLKFQMPTSVEAVGDSCFEGCRSLMSINLMGDAQHPNPMLRILGNNLFVNCSSLADLTLPMNYGEIDALDIAMFKGCESLQFIKCMNKTVNFTAAAFSFEDFIKQITNSKFGPDSFYFEGAADSEIHTTANSQLIAFKYLDEEIYEKVIPDETDNSIKLTYRVDNHNELIYFDMTGNPENVVIPAKIGPYGISKIGSTTFNHLPSLKKITIPSTVTEIAARAFIGSYNLADVIFNEPVNITLIGSDAFSTQKEAAGGGSSDPSLTFTATVGSEPFKYAMDPNNYLTAGGQVRKYITFYSGWPSNLEILYNPATDKNELVDYPQAGNLIRYANQSRYPYITDAQADAARTADQNSTDDQKAITGSALSVVLPAGVESIRTGIFSGKDSSGNNLSGGGTAGGGGAGVAWYQTLPSLLSGLLTPFADPAPSFTANTVPNTSIQSITMETIEEIEPFTFAGCTGLTGVTMKSSGAAGGEKIDNYAFDGCYNLQNVNLPATLTTMGLRPFRGCYKASPVPAVGLTHVNFTDSKNFICENGIIYSLNDGAKAEIVECLESRGILVGNPQVGPEELTGVTGIREEAFMQCNGVGGVDLTKSVITEIPARCFAETANLYAVKLPPTAQSIGTDSFLNSGIGYVSIPDSVTYIEPGAFTGHTRPKVTFGCKEGSAAATYVKRNPDDFVIGEPEDMHTVYYYDGVNPDPAEWKFIDKQSVKDGDAAKPPEPPVHEGYVFDKWSPEYQTVVSDMDIVALYKQVIVTDKTFTVNFINSDDGKILKTQTVNDGGEASPPEVKPKDGYLFTGWVPTDYSKITKDTDFYTQYEKKDAEKLTVTFYNWDNKVFLTQQVDPGGSITAPAGPGREGYTFTGWVPNTFTNITTNLNVVAQFDKNKENNNNNGNNNGNNNNGFNNNGTNGNNNGTNNNNNNNNSTSGNSVSENEVKKYTVAVAGGGGSGSYEPGKTVTINAYATNDGTVFDKWTTSTAGVIFADAANIATTFTMPADNVAISATYKNAETGEAAPAPEAPVQPNSNTPVDVDNSGITDTDKAAATVNGSNDDFIIKITEDAQATDAVLKALQNKYGDLTNVMYLPMDISLYDASGQNKINNTSGITVDITLPLPSELQSYAGNNRMAAVVDGGLEELDSRFTVIDGTPCVNFTATHFSPYVVYVDTANLTEGTIDATPKTGDPIHPKWFLAIGLACVSVLLFCKRDSKEVKAVKA